MNRISWHSALIAAANTTKVGTGTVYEVVRAPENTDLYVDRILFRTAGTNVATVARVFVNNGESNDAESNNSLLHEITLPATTLVEDAAQTEQKIVPDLWLPAGYRLLVTLGTAVAAGYQVTAICGYYQDIQSHPSQK